MHTHSGFRLRLSLSGDVVARNACPWPHTTGTWGGGGGRIAKATMLPLGMYLKILNPVAEDHYKILLRSAQCSKGLPAVEHICVGLVGPFTHIAHGASNPKSCITRH